MRKWKKNGDHLLSLGENRVGFPSLIEVVRFSLFFHAISRFNSGLARCIIYEKLAETSSRRILMSYGARTCTTHTWKNTHIYENYVRFQANIILFGYRPKFGKIIFFNTRKCCYNFFKFDLLRKNCFSYKNSRWNRKKYNNP